ncbi:MAG: class I SAM-dependent methyltransferase [Gammaproteobacteria bacterium]
MPRPPRTRADEAATPRSFGMITEVKDTCRLYTDLAWLWPLWGDASTQYAHYGEHVTGLVRRHARRPTRTLLDIGCGGGKNVLNLARHFEVTGVDLSPAMLAQAKALNPGCRFVEGDIRTFRLGRRFDAVLMDDAISHMSSRADFVAALRTAHAHLEPGGVMVATLDVTTETFRQNRTTTTTAAREGIDVVFVENVYDPDPADEHYETTVLYLIRDHGRLLIETDRWTMGIFALDAWRRVLHETGFEVHDSSYVVDEDAYTVFACIKPA